MNSLALVIDGNYRAVSIVGWERAAKLLVSCRAIPSSDLVVKKVKTINGTFPIPSVIRTQSVVPWKALGGKLRFSRKNIMIRDNYVCQYCGAKLGKAATIDHVIPKSRGGKTNYKNCVACCSKCNNKKSNMIPEEAGMSLLSEPSIPTLINLCQSKIEQKQFDEWNQYI